MTGLVSVLFNNSSSPSRVATVPELGRVSKVSEFALKLISSEPMILKFPFNVIVFSPLSIPVPPKEGGKTLSNVMALLAILEFKA